MMPRHFGLDQKMKSKKKEYKEFYKSFSNDMDDPFDWVHLERKET